MLRERLSLSKMPGIKIGVCLAMTLGLSACSGPNSVEREHLQWMGVGELEPEIYQLDNGLTVILQEDHSAPVVAVQVWVAVGSADELDHEAGLAHVHEHMLFKGTEDRGVGEIAADVEASGGSINAWTSYDQTVYHIVMASRYGEQGLEILADAVRNSTFDAVELTRELEVIQEEIRRTEDQPSRVLSQNLFATAFQAHPYGRPIIGSEESVAAFTREDVLDFYGRWYRAENITLVVVGDVERTTIRAQIESLFGDMASEPVQRPTRGIEPEQETIRTTVDYQEVQEGHLALSFHVPGLAHEDIPALELLTIMLGQGESSILFRQLKRTQELATGVFAFLYTPRDPGILLAGANFRGSGDGPAPLEVLEALLLEVFQLRHVTVSQSDLRRAQTMLESETVYQRQTVQGRANRLGYFHVVAGDLAFEQRFYELAAQVTPEDIRRVAQTYLRPENLTVGFVLSETVEPLQDDEINNSVTTAFDNAEQLAVQDALTPDEHGNIRLVFPNGMRLLIQEDHTVPVVAVRAVFPGGLRVESEESNGIGAFVAELLTGGTTTRTAEEIATEIEGIAGSVGGFSGRNSIGLSMLILSRDIDEGLELFGDCLVNSTFPAEEVARIRRQLLSEIEAQEDDLAGSALRQLTRELFPDHPYRFDLLGTSESIEGLTVDDLQSHFQTHLHPSQMTLAVVGDVDPSVLIRTLERVFDVTETVTTVPVNIPTAQPEPRREVVANRDRQQAHIALGFHGVSLDHPDRWALEVLSALLSGQGGRLFLELRDRRSLAYSVGAFNLTGLDGGYFVNYIATSPSKVAEAIEGMELEIRRLQEELVDVEELGRSQRHLVGIQDISMQRPGARASYLAFDEAYGLGYDQHYSYADDILSVTPEDIQRVARQYLNLELGVLSIVRPGADSSD